MGRGVPQGAVLSPIQVTIFLADLFDAIGSPVLCIVNANDILIYCTDDFLGRCRVHLQDALRKIYQWCQYWNLTVCPENCHAINLSRRKENREFNLFINNSPIPWASEIKFL